MSKKWRKLCEEKKALDEEAHAVLRKHCPEDGSMPDFAQMVSGLQELFSNELLQKEGELAEQAEDLMMKELTLPEGKE